MDKSYAISRDKYCWCGTTFKLPWGVLANMWFVLFHFRIGKQDILDPPIYCAFHIFAIYRIGFASAQLGNPWLGQIKGVVQYSILSSLPNLNPRPLRNLKLPLQCLTSVTHVFLPGWQPAHASVTTSITPSLVARGIRPMMYHWQTLMCCVLAFVEYRVH